MLPVLLAIEEDSEEEEELVKVAVAPQHGEGWRPFSLRGTKSLPNLSSIQADQVRSPPGSLPEEQHGPWIQSRTGIGALPGAAPACFNNSSNPPASSQEVKLPKVNQGHRCAKSPHLHEGNDRKDTASFPDLLDLPSGKQIASTVGSFGNFLEPKIKTRKVYKKAKPAKAYQRDHSPANQIEAPFTMAEKQLVFQFFEHDVFKALVEKEAAKNVQSPSLMAVKDAQSPTSSTEVALWKAVQQQEQNTMILPRHGIPEKRFLLLQDESSTDPALPQERAAEGAVRECMKRLSSDSAVHAPQEFEQEESSASDADGQVDSAEGPQRTQSKEQTTTSSSRAAKTRDLNQPSSRASNKASKGQAVASQTFSVAFDPVTDCVAEQKPYVRPHRSLARKKAGESTMGAMLASATLPGSHADVSDKQKISSKTTVDAFLSRGSSNSLAKCKAQQTRDNVGSLMSPSTNYSDMTGERSGLSLSPSRSSGSPTGNAHSLRDMVTAESLMSEAEHSEGLSDAAVEAELQEERRISSDVDDDDRPQRAPARQPSLSKTGSHRVLNSHSSDSPIGKTAMSRTSEWPGQLKKGCHEGAPLNSLTGDSPSGNTSMKMCNAESQRGANHSSTHISDAVASVPRAKSVRGKTFSVRFQANFAAGAAISDPGPGSFGSSGATSCSSSHFSAAIASVTRASKLGSGKFEKGPPESGKAYNPQAQQALQEASLNESGGAVSSLPGSSRSMSMMGAIAASRQFRRSHQAGSGYRPDDHHAPDQRRARRLIPEDQYVVDETGQVASGISSRLQRFSLQAGANYYPEDQYGLEDLAWSDAGKMAPGYHSSGAGMLGGSRSMPMMGGVSATASPLMGSKSMRIRATMAAGARYNPEEDEKHSEDQSEKTPFQRATAKSKLRQSVIDLQDREKSRIRAETGHLDKEELWAWWVNHTEEKIATEPNVARVRKMERDLALYKDLRDKHIPKGMTGLIHVLEFRLGGIANVFKSLDFNGNGDLSIMEFAGGMSLLGIDLEIFTGLHDHDLFNAIDVDGNGSVDIKEMLAMADLHRCKNESGAEVDKTSNHDDESGNAMQKALLKMNTKRSLSTAAVARSLMMAKRFAYFAKKSADDMKNANQNGGDGADNGSDANNINSADGDDDANRDGAIGFLPNHDLQRAQRKWMNIAKFIALTAGASSSKSQNDGNDPNKDGLGDINGAGSEAGNGADGNGADGFGNGQVSQDGNDRNAGQNGASLWGSMRKLGSKVESKLESKGDDAKGRSNAQSESEKDSGTLRALKANKDADKDTMVSALFASGASAQAADGQPVMTRADVHIFFEDLQAVDKKAWQLLTREKVDKIYNDVMDLQKDMTRVSQGLLVDSFKLVLHKVMTQIGIHWGVLRSFGSASVEQEHTQYAKGKSSKRRSMKDQAKAVMNSQTAVLLSKRSLV